MGKPKEKPRLNKEQSKDRRDTNQQKKKDQRERKKQRSQSEFMPHGNDYRRKRQRDREDSYETLDDYYDFYE